MDRKDCFRTYLLDFYFKENKEKYIKGDLVGAGYHLDNGFYYINIILFCGKDFYSYAVICDLTEGEDEGCFDLENWPELRDKFFRNLKESGYVTTKYYKDLTGGEKILVATEYPEKYKDEGKIL